MKKILKTVFLIGTLTTSLFAHSSSLDKLFIDKSYWTKFNWENFEKSEIFLDKRLTKHEQEVNESKWYFEKFGDVELNGIAFKESIIKHSRLSKNNRKVNLAVISETKNQETCENIIGIFEKHFGTNYERFEYTSGIDKTPLLSKTTKLAEWLNGKTNIKIECTQVFRDNFYVNAVYLPNTEENRVKKPINLSCERNYRVAGSNQTGTAKALHLSVLQEEMEVVNTDNILMGKVDEITNTYIKFTSDLEDAIQKYTINRIDGSLSGTYFNTKINQVTATYNGTCVKRVNEERKF